jgi:hypothetical protein
MNNSKIKELEPTELKRINGGFLIMSSGKIIEYIDKALRAAGAYEFFEGVIDGMSGCGCNE